MTSRRDSDRSVEIAQIAILDGTGETCATLTPVVAARMRALFPGEQLRVISDDDTAPEALASWARLTGNRLVEIIDDGDGRRRFILRRGR